MRRVVWMGLVGLSLALAACSGSRTESLSCKTNADCPEGTCVSGRCAETDESSASVHASSRAEGADVVIEHEVVGDEVCEQRTETVCTLAPGSRVVWKAPVAPGYRFTGWTGDPGCSGSDPTLTLSVEKDVACVAHYVRRWFVTGTVDDGYGEIMVSSTSPFATCTRGSCEVDENADVTLAAPARDGYRLDTWEGEGCGDSDRSSIVVKANADITCRAVYVMSLTVRGSSLGVTDAAIVASSTSENARCDQALCAIDPGANVTLSAPEVPDFRFGGWSGDDRCSSTEREVSLTEVRANVSCTASYIPRFTVSGTSEGAKPEPAITATSQDAFARCEGASCEVDDGGNVVLFAPSVAGMRLSEWEGPGCTAGNGATANVSEVHKDLECKAHYVLGVAVIGTVINADGVITAVSTSPGADCSPGRCVIDVGGSVALTAPALPGRTFQGWSGDQGCTGSERTITLSNVTTSKTCSAKFAARYQVNGVASPAAGGSVVAASTGTNAVCQGRGCNVDEGADVTLTAAASDGFRFTGWSGGGGCTGNTAALVVRGVTSNVSCTANFVQRFTVTSDATPRNGGSTATTSAATAASCSGATCTVDARSDVAVLATPAEGYTFSGWSDCADSTVNPLLLTNVLRAQSCTATFERITLVVSATASAGGTVAGRVGSAACPNASCSVPYGDSVSFTATTSAGYMFGGWTGCTTSAQPTITLDDVTQTSMCRATFTRVRVVVSAVAGEGGAVSASAGGAACANARCTVDFGSSVMLSATPATGFLFGGWTDCTTSASTGITLDNVTANSTCRASFTRMRFSVTTGVAPARSGDVTCSSTGCGVDFGGSLELTARPSSGAFRFVRWSDCSTSTSASLTLTNITGARNCVANFEPVTFQVVAAVAASGGGAVNCTGAGCTVGFGQPLELVATPATGFNFSSWSCTPAVSGATARFTIPSVTSAYRCTATFAPIVRTVIASVAAGGGGTVNCTGAGCRVNNGGSVTLTATPTNNGFTPDAWSCTPALTGTGATLTIPSVTADYRCTVSFRPRTFTVSVASDGGHLAQAAQGVSVCPNGRCTGVPFNGNVILAVSVSQSIGRGSPLLTRWRGCPTAVSRLAGEVEGQYIFTAELNSVQSDLNCVAEFAAGASFFGYTSPPEGGTISGSFTGTGYCLDPTTNVNQFRCYLAPGAVPTFSRTVNSAYIWQGWRCGNATAPSTTDTVSGRPVTANQDIDCGSIYLLRGPD